MTIKRWRHPILYSRNRRWHQAQETIKEEGIQNLRHYRTPVQVCPRGCGYHELARRDVMFRPSRPGWAEPTATFKFETKNCTKCGAPLVGKCARCKQDILAPVVDLCRSCGLPQPWAAERRAGTDRASIRLWRPEKKRKRKAKAKEGVESRVNDPARRLYRSQRKKKKKKGKGKKEILGDLWVIDGNIVQLDVDAVVSNDDVDGQMWTQVARAIKQAAGEGVERLAQEGKPFKLGHAWVTTPGNLQQMKGIIHVASMNRRGESTVGTVKECLAAALQLAAENEYRSIGIGAIGLAAIDRETWFKAFAETTVSFLSGDAKPKGRKVPLSIVLVLFEPPKFEEEVERLRRAVYDEWVRIDKPADGKPKWKPATSAPVEETPDEADE
jgi:O-acetyl-ADP-ribose deacetylase (regulator of RNase III)